MTQRSIDHQPAGVRRTVLESSRQRSSRGVRRLFRDVKAARALRDILSGRTGNLDDVEAYILGHTVRLRVPLVMISQAHRSGGTLLSQLFDGHPALAAHPNELTIGFPSNEDWPPLDPALGADRNFRMMFNDKITGQIRNGYFKGSRGPVAEQRAIFLVPRLQYRVFRNLFDVEPPKTRRDILNYYFTAYFNAWLNYQGELTGKQWITGFAPRLANDERSVAGFFDSYPDGWLVQVIRDPITWYASARRHGSAAPKPKGKDAVLRAWTTSAESMLRNKAVYSEKTVILRFEDLIGRTEDTMRVLARKLDIGYDPVLARPTFNRGQMWANSSYAVETPGVIDEPLKREKSLAEEERRHIQRQCFGLYENVLANSIYVGSA